MNQPVTEFYDDDDRLVATGEAVLKHFGTSGNSLEHKVFVESNVKRNPGGRFSKSSDSKFTQGPIDFENFKIGDLSTLKMGNLATIKRSDGSKLIDSNWGFLKKYNAAVKKIAALDRSFSAKGQAWLKSSMKKVFPGPSTVDADISKATFLVRRNVKNT